MRVRKAQKGWSYNNKRQMILNYIVMILEERVDQFLSIDFELSQQPLEIKFSRLRSSYLIIILGSSVLMMLYVCVYDRSSLSS